MQIGGDSSQDLASCFFLFAEYSTIMQNTCCNTHGNKTSPNLLYGIELTQCTVFFAKSTKTIVVIGRVLTVPYTGENFISPSASKNFPGESPQPLVRVLTTV